MISFRPAVRENVNLLIGLAGASGSGKTFTAFRLASGMSGGKRFAVIDTENGRASHYADQFAFDVAELREPFSPDRYADAIKAADDAGYPVIVIDSASHEFSGSGGILDMQEEEFKRLGERDAAKMLSWVKPKGEHKKMMQRLLQVKAHLIMCLRAEPKIEMKKGPDGKMQIAPKESLIGYKGWIPITEKSVPFELTVSFMLTPDAPGIPHPIKLQEQHKSMFPLDAPISEESGKSILAWAKGGLTTKTYGESKTYADEQQMVTDITGHPSTALPPSQYISGREAADLEARCSECGIPAVALLKVAGVPSFAKILLPNLARAHNWINAQVKAREAHEAATRG